MNNRAEDSILVLGATGSFGSAVALEFLARGYGVRALVRDVAKARRLLGDHKRLELIAGDVQDVEAVTRAAKGCSVLVHGINYPYDQWFPNMERATANVLAAARPAGATIVFPGNVYNLGNHPEHPLGEDAPNDPCTRKGRLRAQLEEALQRASGEKIRVLIVRAGNYFGPTVRNGLVDPVFGNAVKGKAILTLGRMDKAQQWAYVPDLARATVDLTERRAELAPYQVVNFEGVVYEPLGDFYRRVAQAAGKPKLAVRLLPWWLLRIAGLFDGVVRELLEMRYLWSNSIILDGALMKRLLPGFQPTPLDQALAATLQSYGQSHGKPPA